MPIKLKMLPVRQNKHQDWNLIELSSFYSNVAAAWTSQSHSWN